MVRCHWILIDNRNIMFYCKFFVSHHMLFQIHMLGFIHMISIGEIVRLQMAPILEKKIVYFSIILFHFQKKMIKNHLPHVRKPPELVSVFNQKWISQFFFICWSIHLIGASIKPQIISKASNKLKTNMFQVWHLQKNLNQLSTTKTTDLFTDNWFKI